MSSVLLALSSILLVTGVNKDYKVCRSLEGLRGVIGVTEVIEGY